MEWDGTEWKCEKIESIYMSSFSCDRMRASDTGVCVPSSRAHACYHTLYTSPFHSPSSPFPKISSCLLGRYHNPVPT